MLFDPFFPINSVLQPVARWGFVPPVDVTVSENDMVVTLDVPGFTADDVELEVLNGHLFVRGERNRPELSEGSHAAYTERTFGRFERRITLPEGVDPDAITASMDNGVLSLIIPKPEALKPRTIAIGSGDGQRHLTESAR